MTSYVPRCFQIRNLLRQRLTHSAEARTPWRDLVKLIRVGPVTSLRQQVYLCGCLRRPWSVWTAPIDDLHSCGVAMTDPGRRYDYPLAVRLQIHDETMGEYVQATEFLNNAGFDVVCLQHEYRIFGGDVGRNIIELLSRLEMPLITALHAVRPIPTPVRRDVMCRIIDDEDHCHVGERPRIPRSANDAPPRKIEMMPHGILDDPFLETHHAKEKFGLAGKKIILTFGFPSAGKLLRRPLAAERSE